jgi:hypothetical protein
MLEAACDFTGWISCVAGLKSKSNGRAGRRPAAEMVEHDFMGEQGSPVEGRRPVGIAAANQFVLAVAVLDEPGPAKLLDDTAGDALGDDLI